MVSRTMLIAGAMPLNTDIVAPDSSALAPASLYLLHPCSRVLENLLQAFSTSSIPAVLSRHTTAMDGGSVENVGTIFDQSIHGHRQFLLLQNWHTLRPCK